MLKLGFHFLESIVDLMCFSVSKSVFLRWRDICTLFKMCCLNGMFVLATGMTKRRVIKGRVKSES